MPFDAGRIAVMTIGGWGRWNGLSIAPCPRSGIQVRSVVRFQIFPFSRYGGSCVQSAIMWSIDSRNNAFRSASSPPNISASERKPPGPMPRMNRPSSSVSTIAISAAAAAGCLFARLTVPLPSLMCLVSRAKVAMKIRHEVMVSARSVTCSPTNASS